MTLAKAVRARPVTVVLACLMVLAAMLGTGGLSLNAPSALSLVACHFSHLSLTQLLFAGGTTLLLAASVERELGPWRLVLVITTAAAAIDATLLTVLGHKLSGYTGSSGVGHALAAVWALRVAPPRWRGPATVILLAKVGAELLTGSAALVAGLGNAVPVPESHAVGVAAGLLASLAFGGAFQSSVSTESSSPESSSSTKGSGGSTVVASGRRYDIASALP